MGTAWSLAKEGDSSKGKAQSAMGSLGVDGVCVLDKKRVIPPRVIPPRPARNAQDLVSERERESAKAINAWPVGVMPHLTRRDTWLILPVIYA